MILRSSNCNLTIHFRVIMQMWLAFFLIITLSRWIINVFMDVKSHIIFLLGETELYK